MVDEGFPTFCAVKWFLLYKGPLAFEALSWPGLSPPGTLCFLMKAEVLLKLLLSSLQPRPLSPWVSSLGVANNHLKHLACLPWSSSWQPRVQDSPSLASPSTALKIPSIFAIGEATSSEIFFFRSISWLVAELVSKSKRNGKYQLHLSQDKRSWLFSYGIVISKRFPSSYC